MTKQQALEVVLDLAKQNVLDGEDDRFEHDRQVEAIEIVEATYK